MYGENCAVSPIPSLSRKGRRAYPLTAHLMDACMGYLLELRAECPGAWVQPRSSGERRTKEQPVGRLAEMVFWDALSCQSLPSNGETGYGTWERNKCIPKHPS